LWVGGLARGVGGWPQLGLGVRPLMSVGCWMLGVDDVLNILN